MSLHRQVNFLFLLTDTKALSPCAEGQPPHCTWGFHSDLTVMETAGDARLKKARLLPAAPFFFYS